MTERGAARAAVAIVVLLGARTSVAAAQRSTGGCDGKTVSAINVHSQPPYPPNAPRVIQAAIRALTSFHGVTRPYVIRSFLALRKGQTCTQVRVAESERILRDLPFIVAAEITETNDGSGRVRLDVYTVDEITFLADASVQRASPYVTYARLGDGDLAGQGIFASADWREGFLYRDHYGIQIVDYQTFGRPYGLDLQASRDQLGGGWRATYVDPFYSDLQHIGWLLDIGETRRYVPFLPATLPYPIDLDYKRHFEQLGGIVRLGGLGHLTLYGLTLSHEREEAGSMPLLATDSGPQVLANAVFPKQYSQTEATRLNVLWGVRDIEYKEVHGFDALTGAQDIGVGMQFGTQIGRSFPPLAGPHENDLFTAASLYGGWGNTQTLIGFQANGEARQDLQTSGWDGILTGARLAWYFKPAPQHTLILSSEFGMGLNQRLPFALTLSDPDGGLLGYGSAHVVGGMRQVNRIEERWSWGSYRHVADFGIAVFVNAGRMWSEDVPYGVNTPYVVGAGFGILAAIPSHSKRVLRIDFAEPFMKEPYGGFQIRFSTTDRTEAFYVEPRDLASGRERTVPTSIFQFPQPY